MNQSVNHHLEKIEKVSISIVIKSTDVVVMKG